MQAHESVRERKTALYKSDQQPTTHTRSRATYHPDSQPGRSPSCGRLGRRPPIPDVHDSSAEWRPGRRGLAWRDSPDVSCPSLSHHTSFSKHPLRSLHVQRVSARRHSSQRLSASYSRAWAPPTGGCCYRKVQGANEICIPERNLSSSSIMVGVTAAPGPLGRRRRWKAVERRNREKWRESGLSVLGAQWGNLPSSCHRRCRQGRGLADSG